MDFTRELPMQFSYKYPTFYVRECYPQYHEMITNLLKEGAQVVTVTGTSGVGTSVFSAYFLRRYSMEYFNITIITASFETEGEKSKMTKVVVWKAGVVIGQAEDQKSAIKEVDRTVIKEARSGLIYLYDGPPNRRPQNAQMVCFTSWNKTWFSYLKERPDRPKLIMPSQGTSGCCRRARFRDARPLIATKSAECRPSRAALPHLRRRCARMSVHGCKFRRGSARCD
ncbi:hypothetical protein JG688_00010349 [Phytophthora aleatoria]|uniref:Uncharacterized protein n=1 Tax=Phytophthora aleatoria TaxID=2496075 RepID=A0A8J5IEM2_9STRA|nr:hypothetical protein JG688_00010349 [Phytophthora aleatoria]